MDSRGCSEDWDKEKKIPPWQGQGWGTNFG
jgi:hypothetical protein